MRRATSRLLRMREPASDDAMTRFDLLDHTQRSMRIKLDYVTVTPLKRLKLPLVRFLWSLSIVTVNESRALDIELRRQT